MAEALREGGNANIWCLLFLARWYQVEMSMCKYELPQFNISTQVFKTFELEANLSGFDHNHDETLLFIVAVHGVVVGVSRWMSWPGPWVPTFGPQRWKWGANLAF